MNRTAFCLMAIAGLMAFSSCTSEMTEEIAQSDNTSAVFTIGIPSSLGSRAGSYGDGVNASIDKLTYSVFKVTSGEDEASYSYEWLFDETKDYTSIGFGTDIINIPLVKNVTYRIAFCAYSSKCTGGYATFSKGVLTVDYSKCAVNNAEQDMFVKRSEVFTVEGGHEEELTLARPFAQLNWGASDAFAQSLEEYRDKMKVQVKLAPGIVCSELYVVENKATELAAEGDELLELPQFNFASIPSQDNVAFPVANSYKPYNMVAMHYLLVKPADNPTGKVKLEFRGGLQDIDVSVDNAPLMANYRTNIYGDLLTSPGVFGISLDSAFGDGGDSNHENPTIDVKNPTTTE